MRRPEEQQRPTGVRRPSASSSSDHLPPRLPKSRRSASASPSQAPPPWMPPGLLRLHTLRRRGSMGERTPGSSSRFFLNPSVPMPEKWLDRSPEKSLNVNPDLDAVHFDLDPGSAKRRKSEEATPQLQPSEPQLVTHMPINKEGDVSQEELAQEMSGSDSSTCSSPIREPQPPLVPIWTNSAGKVYYGLTSDRAALDTYYDADQKYKEKLARQEQLPTLRPSLTVSAIMESYGPKQKEILLDASKSILSLSAYLDGKEINRCTGIVIEWNEEKGYGIILTSAWLICTNKPFSDWSDKEYASKAKVLIHLLDGSTLNSKLLYFSEHYDLAFYEVSGDLQLKILTLETNLECGQDLCLLARDMKMDLICKAVNVKYLDPCEHQHNHYLFVNHSIPKCGSGGALADLNGRVAGLLFCTLPLTAFIPSSLILKCSVLLRKFGRLARPKLVLKLRTVGFLDLSSIESLSRSCGITSGLIVGEVSAECVAERLGIRAGDVILSCQGRSVSSVTHWEEILLGIGGEHLEKSNDLSLKVDVEVDVFHVRKGIRRTITLNVELSDGNEVFHSV
ncbi:unnamed protein product [Urochloa humidicola]